LPRSRRLTCREVVELVSGHLEGTLAPVVRAGVEAHLRLCPNCAAYVQQVRTMVRALRRVAPPPVDPSARARLLELFRRWTAA
jgi:anti-sigma factor RsiW